MGAPDTHGGQVIFPRSARLTTPTDFSRVFQRNAVSSDRYFRVMARPGASDTSRLGMAVSRKVDKRAVVRNRIKRVVRESFRHYRSNPGITLDIVVLARADSATISRSQLFQSLERHWREVERKAERRFMKISPPEGRDQWEI